MDIRTKIRETGFFQWEIAEKVGVAESTMCRWLRRPELLDPKMVERIEAAIAEIMAERRDEK